MNSHKVKPYLLTRSLLPENQEKPIQMIARKINYFIEGTTFLISPFLFHTIGYGYYLLHYFCSCSTRSVNRSSLQSAIF
jgi:hypothetical protein